MCVDGQQLITKHLYSKVVLMSDSGAAIPAIGSYERPSTNILECRGLLERLKVEGRHVALQWINGHFRPLNLRLHLPAQFRYDNF
ncbi:hypothetical protein CDAR_601461 [Caerostris darwini]|uniref:Uncharacterized protein n=1 Tax=Caerostris darwini TaxID=1538125 RepID=A0AAV4V1B7_9ARAC|nr:hypothetical protein CDAR_601461 [Caerostris darwini]